MKLEARDVSESTVLVVFPDAPDTDANLAAVEIGARLTAKPRRGLVEAIPGARTLFLSFDPRAIDREALLRRVQRLADEPAEASSDSRLFRIPVAYGGENGPDLATLARDHGMDPEEVARRHESAEYRVAFLGFSPGFAYLTGLPAELHSPRRDSPRPRVPAGSVALGGPYTAVYPTDSPGGWRLIGRSSVRLFDPFVSPPALLRPGDRVRFERIDDGELARRIAASAQHPAPAAVPEGEPVFAAITPGLFTSVQGGPRHGLGSCGVPAGGAMDATALERGNAMVGNPPGAAALEVTLSGPELRVLDDAVACVSGGDFQARCNGKLLELDAPFELKAGDHVAFGYARRGARAYLCVRGGLVERRPGEPLKRLARGDVVTRGRLAERAYAAAPRRPDSAGEGVRVLRVLEGPQSTFFSAAATEVFFSASYRVSPESDRRGIRLDGPAIELRRPSDISPEGTALGTIQVPAGGLPIVLGPDRPVTGGYAKIATVIRRDWPLLAQAPPGTAVRFRAVTLAEAIEMLGQPLD